MYFLVRARRYVTRLARKATNVDLRLFGGASRNLDPVCPRELSVNLLYFKSILVYERNYTKKYLKAIVIKFLKKIVSFFRIFLQASKVSNFTLFF